MPKRAGILLIACGLALAGLAAYLVMGITRQATEASHAQVRQVAVVTAKRDILEDTMVTADALEVKTFPADFAPPGAFSELDNAVGKWATGFIPRGQIVVGGQLESARTAPNLSDRIAAGMVVTWLPLPDVLANQNVLHPGDRLDILLTAPMKSGNGNDRSTDILSTQTTLQNVLVFRVGDDEFDRPGASSQANQNPAQAAVGAGANNANTRSGASGPKTVGFLVDHQDAVTLKFVKDAGGTIDLVMRSQDDQAVVPTDGVTLDSLADRFHFRVPQPAVRGDSPRASTGGTQ
jgi:pilus assembly protein CpaB